MWVLYSPHRQTRSHSLACSVSTGAADVLVPAEEIVASDFVDVCFVDCVAVLACRPSDGVAVPFSGGGFDVLHQDFGESSRCRSYGLGLVTLINICRTGLGSVEVWRCRG